MYEAEGRQGPHGSSRQCLEGYAHLLLAARPTLPYLLSGPNSLLYESRRTVRGCSTRCQCWPKCCDFSDSKGDSMPAKEHRVGGYYGHLQPRILPPLSSLLGDQCLLWVPGTEGKLAGLGSKASRAATRSLSKCSLSRHHPKYK